MGWTLIDWPCRQGSSTSGATKQPATSAPRRRCWQTCLPCTRSIMGHTASRTSPPGCTKPPSCSLQVYIPQLMLIYVIICDAVFNGVYAKTLGARKAGHEVMNPHFFDTVRLSLDCDMSVVQQRARQKQINLRYHTDHTVIIRCKPHTTTTIIGFEFLKLE
jgi:hypothetical protein